MKIDKSLKQKFYAEWERCDIRNARLGMRHAVPKKHTDAVDLPLVSIDFQLHSFFGNRTELRSLQECDPLLVEYALKVLGKLPTIDKTLVHVDLEAKYEIDGILKKIWEKEILIRADFAGEVADKEGLPGSLTTLQFSEFLMGRVDSIGKSYFDWMMDKLQERADAPVSNTNPLLISPVQAITSADSDKKTFGVTSHPDQNLLSSYQLEVPVGQWQGRFDIRTWGKSTNLFCYFTDMASGAKRRLSVFRSNGYRPYQEGPRFDEEIIGTKYEITSGKSVKNQLPTFLKAIKII